MSNIINPYKSVVFGSYIEVPSCSHTHCKRQDILDRLVDGGLRHLALSNYHPSRHWYPLNESHIENGITYNFNIPEGIIGSPNAEFWNMEISQFHANGLGTLYEEDSKQAPSATWRYKFKLILEHLQYSDGGGITLNHPAWTKVRGTSSSVLTNKDLMDMLDFDDRVLGIEFYNQNDIETRWALDTWDEILKTGRRCWGFCVADWGPTYTTDWTGRNILLCDSNIMNTGTTAEKEHECLKAYREGRFYGSIKGTNLKFTEISINGNTITVSTTGATSLNIVVNGVSNIINSDSTTYTVPNYATYVRVEGHNDADSIYSNPIIFKPLIKEDSTAKKMLLIG